MSKYIIESDVPLPYEARGRNKTAIRHALDSLEVGQSFSFPPEEHSKICNIRSAIRRIDRGKNFLIDKALSRVWRTE